MFRRLILCIVVLSSGIWYGCLSTSSKNQSIQLPNKLQYAENFKWYSTPSYDLLEVSTPLENSKTERYLVVPKGSEIPEGVAYDVLIRPGLEKVIATSTPQIAALESLDLLDYWVGFPQPELISSAPARQRIKAGLVTPIGVNNGLNVEKIWTLQPELFLGFEVDGNNPSYTQLKRMGVPLVLVHDWMEKTPLGKAEWLLFFGVLFGKQQVALQQFKAIEKRYYELLQKVPKNTDTTAVVLAGSVYKDQWYAPGGQSFMAQFLADCQVQYTGAHTKETGSLTLSLERLMLEGHQADVWLTPGSFDSYQDLLQQYPMLESIKPFQNKKIYTYKKYSIDGEAKILYFEQAGLHPDKVLADLLKIFYPEVFLSTSWHYFTPLK